jgi:energy-coupling factor transporter transmembrane protein EcfT
MSSIVDIYLKRESPLHRLDERAKLLGTAGFVIAVLLASARPVWPALALLGLLAVAIALGRVPPLLLLKRLAGLVLIVGVPFALSRLGSQETRAAGEQFVLKSLLVASGFVVLTATTRPIDLLEAIGRVPMLAVLAALGEAILRGVNVLAGEVVRSHRALSLRAPKASVRLRLAGMMAASASLLGRAAARSERVGAAMVLRGFTGRMPPSEPRPLALRDMCCGAGFGLVCLLLSWVGRWG